MPMTKSWPEIVAHYDAVRGDSRSIQALATLARRITETALASGLFAWTSMLDLCVVQTEVSYPYNGPLLRISAVSNEQLEFRYEDTLDKTKQWHRTVDADEAIPRMLRFLDQLRWFPADVLNSVADSHGSALAKSSTP
jgi:hypothetical protein